MALDRVSTENPQVLSAAVVGGALTLIGLVGLVLVPEEGRLFGVFGVNTLHNLAHVATGLPGLAAGLLAGGRYSRRYNQGFGLLYLAFFVGGVFVVAVTTLLNANFADNLLHFVLALGLGMVGFGIRSDDEVLEP